MKKETTKNVAVKTETSKRISHLKLGPALLAKKASQEEINKAFTDSFAQRSKVTGKTYTKDFIAKRIKIYMAIAAKKIAADKAKTATKTA